jgi:hypothetical protein
MIDYIKDLQERRAKLINKKELAEQELKVFQETTQVVEKLEILSLIQRGIVVFETAISYCECVPSTTDPQKQYVYAQKALKSLMDNFPELNSDSKLKHMGLRKKELLDLKQGNVQFETLYKARKDVQSFIYDLVTVK